MQKSLLSVHLTDEQISNLNNALCQYRDHYISLLNALGPASTATQRHSETVWKEQIRDTQELIDSINDSLYGSYTEPAEAHRADADAQLFQNLFEAPD